MAFDRYDTPQAEGWRRAARLRGRLRLSRVARIEGVAAALVLAAAITLLLVPGHEAPARPFDIVLAAGIFFAADLVTFPAGPGWAPATQLAFVPMLTLVPVGWVPALIVALRLVQGALRRRLNLVVCLTRIADCAYATGPVTVLLIAGVHGFHWNDWPVWCLAFLAQVAVDLGTGLARTWAGERLSPREIVPVIAWLYPVDLALTCVGLFVAGDVQNRPGLELMIVPLIALLQLFARERRQRVESVLTLTSTYRETAELLGEVLEDDDAPTGVHSRQVAELSVDVAERLDLDPVAIFNVRYGALLHDVGKISVPKSILQKPSPLNREEWAIMREHTVRGEEMLARLGGSLTAVGHIVRHTHERWDGGGYPDGLMDEQIPLESRIIAVADTWNAMTSDRPYRRALSVELAAHELSACAGTQFDPAVVAVLLPLVAPGYPELAARVSALLDRR